MWNPSSASMASKTMWKLFCAMAVSNSVLAFTWTTNRKETPQHLSYFGATNSFAGWQSPFQQRYTLCEAALQPGILEDESSYEKMELPPRIFYEGHAIFGALLGENMIESYDVYKRSEGSNNDNVIVAYVKLGNRIDGHKGVIHGGILSLIFDDALGFGFGALDIKMAFTANLSVDYRTPVPAGTKVRVQAQLDRREGRKLYWKAQMTSMDGETLFAECTSLYIIPRSHA